jgi:hypothetical protein
MLLVFLADKTPTFPYPFGCHAALRLAELSKRLPLRCLHLDRGADIALRSRRLPVHGQIAIQSTAGVLPQCSPRRGVRAV